MPSCDLVIAGIGGQGIQSLAKIIATLADRTGWWCLSTIHKGGAQTLGSVSAELRLRPEPQAALAATIPAGHVDVLIALEPWEGLRQIATLGPATSAIAEREPQSTCLSNTPFNRDPISELCTWCTTQVESLRQQATEIYLDARMANVLAGEMALNYLPAPLSCRDTYWKAVTDLIPQCAPALARRHHHDLA